MGSHVVSWKKGSVFPSEPQGPHQWKGAVIKASEVAAVRAALTPVVTMANQLRGPLLPSEARICQLLQAAHIICARVHLIRTDLSTTVDGHRVMEYARTSAPAPGEHIVPCTLTSESSITPHSHLPKDTPSHFKVCPPLSEYMM